MLLRPQRPIGQIYVEAATQAIALATRAEQLAETVKDKKDKNQARDNAAFARRFANKAQKASTMVVTLMNDGELKAYCQRFDKVFEQFIQFAASCEKELNEIEERAK